MKNLSLTFILFCVLSIQAQVGIGTTNPTSQMEIKTTATGIPALELNPQSAPIGTSTGQISVIGDKLYMFDDGRGKWLSVESMMLNFGLENGTDDQHLEYVGDILLSGPKMPFDGTVVYITMNASGGQANKQVQLFQNNLPVLNNADASLDGLLALDGYTFTETDYNLDFNAGDHFRVKVTSTGVDVENLSVLLWVKWRE